jgi:hypothetical protein
MSIFANKIFCLHGFDPDKHQALSAIIQQHGGSLCTEITAKVRSLLICCSDELISYERRHIS